MRALAIALLLAGAGCTPGDPPPRAEAAPDPAPAPRATWGAVELGGGGAVPGVVPHPRIADLAYIRTDVGGAYRWDEAGRRWIPLLDAIPAERWNLYGVESLAVDALDPTGGTVAVALGKYADPWARPQRGRIAVSHDRGATWQESGPELAIAANRQQRNGERLAFDATVPSRLWYASMADGLWRGDGEAWTRIDLPGAVTACAAMALHGATLWVASSERGVLESRDGGGTWTALGGVVERAHRLCTTADGRLIAVHAAGVHRRDGDAWTAITPPDAPKGIQTVCADPRDPLRLVAAERITHNARLFRSDDGGASWRIFAPARRPTAAWWPQLHWISSPFALAFDPQRPGRLWLSDWYAAYRCDDIDAAEPTLTNLVDGLEEIVTLTLAVPFAGPHQLMSGVADNGGFDHERVDRRPAATIWASGGPRGLTCTGIDACPDGGLAARVGVLGGDRKGPAAGSWSADGGRTWTPFARVPGAQPATGRIAVGADGRQLVWALHGAQGVFTSSDRGATWQAGVPDLGAAVGTGGVWNWQQPLAADRVAPGTFYLLGGPGLWRSADGGATWSLGASAASDGARAIAAHPFRAGVLWLALGGKGLARSDDGGRTLTRLPALESAELVSAGAGADPDRPLLYVLGRAGGRHGIFVSRDLGATCEPLEVPGQAFGNQPNILAGDVRTAGRCFVGSNGRGILWFQIAP